MSNPIKDPSSNNDSTSSDALPAPPASAAQNPSQSQQDHQGAPVQVPVPVPMGVDPIPDPTETNKRRPDLQDENKTTAKRARVESNKNLEHPESSESEPIPGTGTETVATAASERLTEEPSLREQLLETDSQSTPIQNAAQEEEEETEQEKEQEENDVDTEAQKERDALVSRGRLVLTGPAGFERWRAHQKAEDYIDLVGKMMYPGTYLAPFGYDATTGQYPIECLSAMSLLQNPLRRPSVIEKWSPLEIATFEAAMIVCGKEFHKVRSFVKTKTTKEVIEFYYVWKKTGHYKVWKSQYVSPDMELDSDEE